MASVENPVLKNPNGFWDKNVPFKMAIVSAIVGIAVGVFLNNVYMGVSFSVTTIIVMNYFQQSHLKEITAHNSKVSAFEKKNHWGTIVQLLQRQTKALETIAQQFDKVNFQKAS